MKKRLVHGSPWILAAACALLAIIIGLFAVNNYRREKALMVEALYHKGDAVIRFLGTGVRVSLRAHRQGGGALSTNILSHVQGVINQLQEQEDIHFVQLIAESGEILAATNEEQVGTVVDDQTMHFLKEGGNLEPSYRIRRDDDVKPGFQVVRIYKSPMMGMMGPDGMMRDRGRMMENQRRNRGAPQAKVFDGSHQNSQVEQEFFLLVELDLAQFNSAVQRQLFQLAVLSVVLLLVGTGGWLSLLTLQGYKGTQSQLRRVSAFNDLLVATLPLGLIATGREGRIQLINEAAALMLGIDADSVQGGDPLAVLPEVLAKPLTKKSSGKGGLEQREVNLTCQNGEERTLFITTTRVYDEQQIKSGEVLLFQDVSDIRILETELRRSERMAALGKMAAGVAHELRNPLSSIKGLALLLRSKASADGKETAEVLVQEVERLNRSISELLDYARPERLQVEEASLHQLLDKAVTLVGIDAGEQGIQIATNFAAINDRVMVDADRMNQVVLNLLLNGIQAMPDGGLLQVRTTSDDEWVQVEIEDSGIGIAEEHLTRVFDPYFTTKNDGTGLGLSLSAKIVEEHEGLIALESKQGAGTTAKIQIRRTP